LNDSPDSTRSIRVFDTNVPSANTDTSSLGRNANSDRFVHIATTYACVDFGTGQKCWNTVSMATMATVTLCGLLSL
jgi:hypothetical protein